MDHPFRNLAPVLLLPFPILAGFLLGLGAGRGRMAVAAGFLLLSLLLVSSRRSKAAAACAVAALCGVLSSARLPLLDPERARPFLGREVVLHGKVYQVRNTEAGWSGVALEAVVSLPDGSGFLPAGRVLLSVRNPDASVPFPAEVRATGRLRPIQSRGNPGEIPREWTALALGVQYRFAADASRAVFLPMEDRDGRVSGFFLRARARAGRWLSRHAGDSDGAMYLRTVATGESPPPSHPMVALLRRTGLAHLLAISGVHVVLFFAVLSYLARIAIWAIRRRHGTPDLARASAVFSLPVCWAYALMAGAPVSAVRAAGMLTVVVILRHLLGVRAPAAAWAALFLLTVAVAPNLFFSPSFLLSYGASFFLIAAFAGRKGSLSSGPDILGRALYRGRDALSGSAIAFLGTLPVSAAFFGHLPAGAVLWNLLFAPLLGTVGVIGAFLGTAGGVLSVDLLGGAVRLAGEVLGGIFAVLARISGDGAGYCPLPPSGVLAPLACTGAAAAGSLWLRGRGRSTLWAAAAGSAAFLAWIHAPYAALPDHRLTVAALNVGKGAAHVVSFPGGGHMLIDCGGGTYADAGGGIVVPYLRGRGIRRIDVLVLTHPHEDHYGGADAVLSRIPVGEIWIPDGFSPEAFGKAVGGRAERVRMKSRGDRYVRGGAEVVVRGTGRDGSHRGVNERSLVLEIRHGSISAWLPGDVERGPAAWEAEAPADGRESRVLFLPHHGSPGAQPAAWIRFASPAAVVSQNTDCFREGNLLPSVQSFFLENGAVTLRSDGDSVLIGQERHSRLWKLLMRLSPER